MVVAKWCYLWLSWEEVPTISDKIALPTGEFSDKTKHRPRLERFIFFIEMRKFEKLT